MRPGRGDALIDRLAFGVEGLRAKVRIGWDWVATNLAPPPPEAPPALVGEPVRRRGGLPPPAADEALRVLSWNIHRGYDEGAVVRSLTRMCGQLAPQLILLQEVPAGRGAPFWEREGIRELLAGWDLFFAPMHAVAVPSRYYPFSTSGLLLASRLPMTGSAAWALPRVSRPKLGRGHEVRRVAATAVLETARGSLRVVALHLENTARPSGRARQLREVLERLDAGGGAHTATLVAGDLNTFLGRREAACRELGERGFVDLLAGERRLLPALDHLYLRGGGARRAFRVTAAGSDHRPLFAEVEVTVESGPGSTSPQSR